MKKNILKIWTRIQNKDTAFSENDFIQFNRDFSELMDDLWYKYKSFSSANLKKLVKENAELFNKLADILQYEPKFFSAEGIYNWLFEVFETGEMPQAGIFAQNLPWDAEDVAPIACLYIKDPNMRKWIVQHWSICKDYRFSILRSLNENKIFDASMFKIYNPHFFRKLTIYIISMAALLYIFFNNFIPLILLICLAGLISYWISKELYFAIRCKSIKAFW